MHAANQSQWSNSLCLMLLPELLPKIMFVEPDPHCTVFWGGDLDDLPEDATGALMREAEWANVTAIPKGFKRFVGGPQSDQGDPFVLLLDSPQMVELHNRIVKELGKKGIKSPSRFVGKDYTPHMTIGYLDADEETPDLVLPTEVINFSKAWVSSGNSNYVNDNSMGPVPAGRGYGWQAKAMIIDVETKKGRLDWSPRSNWVEDNGGLPAYIEDIALALIRDGKARSQAIAIAIGTVKRWARGGGNVTAKTRAKAAAALAKWEALKAKAKIKRATKDDQAWDQEVKRHFDTDERRKAAADKVALPDGSFPIKNRTDLRNAIRLCGRASDPTRAKAHIKKRARALGLESLIPDDWNTERKESIMELETKSLSGTGQKGIEVIDAEQGIVEAIVAVTGIKDGVDDVIMPGAFKDSLAARTPKGCFAHDIKTAVSKALWIKEMMPGDPDLPKTLADGSPWPAEAGALKTRAQFNLNSTLGKDAFATVQFFEEDQEWSIGYRVKPKDAAQKDGVRYIKAMDVYEFSPVTWGAMGFARTTNTGNGKSLIEDHLKALSEAMGDDFALAVKSLLPTEDQKPKDEDQEDDEDQTVDEDQEVDPEPTDEWDEDEDDSDVKTLLERIEAKLDDLQSHVDNLPEAEYLGKALVDAYMGLTDAGYEGNGYDELITEYVKAIEDDQDDEVIMAAGGKIIDAVEEDLGDDFDVELNGILEAVKDMEQERQEIDINAAPEEDAGDELDEVDQELIGIVEDVESQTVHVSLADAKSLFGSRLEGK